MSPSGRTSNEAFCTLHPFLRLREHPVHEIPVTEDTFIPEKILTVHRHDVRPATAASLPRMAP